MPISDPTDIAGCTLWLAADAIVGLSDGDPVGTWADASGGGDDATASGGVRPTYQTGELNSLPVVRFDGSNDVMVTGSLQAQTVFMVLQIKANALVDGVWGASGANMNIRRDVSSSTRWRGIGNTDSNDWSFGGSFFIDGSATDTQAENVYAILCAIQPTAQTDTWEIGGDTSNARYGNCDIAEVITYNSALGTTDRQSVETYLTAKWFTSGGSFIDNTPNILRALWGGMALGA